MTATTSRPWIFGVLCAVFFVVAPMKVGAQVVKFQPLNNLQFSAQEINNDYAFAIHALGNFATGTQISGVQLQTSNVNATLSPNVSFSIRRYASEAEWQSQGSNTNAGELMCGGLLSGTTDASGFLNAPCSFTAQGFPFFYAFVVFPHTTHSMPFQSFLGTNGTAGVIIYYSTQSTNAIATTTNNSFYYQVYSGNSPQQFFTPAPGFAGFATSTVAQTCDNSFATSSGFLDSVASSISNGMCRVLSFLFVPSPTVMSQYALLASTTQGKIPFSYVYGAQAIFSTLTASTTGNLVSVAYDLPNISSSTPLGSFYPTHIVGLSTSTISTYLPDSIRNTLLNMQRVVLWAGFLFLMYRRVIPHKAKI